jgi:hypothetical protein
MEWIKAIQLFIELALIICLFFLVHKITLIPGLGEYIKIMFSEDNKPRPSYGKHGSFIAILASVAWVSWIVYKTNVIPDLGGICFFIGTPYGLSKGINAVRKIKEAQNGPT